MSEFDPLTLVSDQPLEVNDGVIAQLRDLREQEHLPGLPGVNIETERARLSAVVNGLLDSLIASVSSNPSKLWVMRQFQLALQQVQREDTEAREHFGLELEQVMDTLGIDSSDGMLSFYLGGI